MEFEDLVIVRCGICETERLLGEDTFMLLKNSFPVKFITSIMTPSGIKQVQNELFICERHYERLKNPPVITIERPSDEH